MISIQDFYQRFKFEISFFKKKKGDDSDGESPQHEEGGEEDPWLEPATYLLDVIEQEGGDAARTSFWNHGRHSDLRRPYLTASADPDPPLPPLLGWEEGERLWLCSPFLNNLRVVLSAGARVGLVRLAPAPGRPGPGCGERLRFSDRTPLLLPSPAASLLPFSSPAAPLLLLPLLSCCPSPPASPASLSSFCKIFLSPSLCRSWPHPLHLVPTTKAETFPPWTVYSLANRCAGLCCWVMSCGERRPCARRPAGTPTPPAAPASRPSCSRTPLARRVPGPC